MDLVQVIEKIREEVPGNRERGECFEKICKAFLKNDPRYKDMFSEVWLWNEFPERKEADTGVDLVAKDIDENLWAIQCKFYDSDHLLDKSSIDSFFTTSGRYGFSERVIISTTNRWTKNAEHALEGQSIKVQRWGIREMNESPIEWEDIYNPGKISIKQQKDLKLHQEEALESVVNGFNQSDRGKLIMACGTGKTLTSLKIMERIVSEGGNVLFLVPSISLLSQTLREWVNEAKLPQRNFAVCSDSKIGKNNEDIRTYELAFPTTTDPQKLADKLTEKSFPKINIVFSTYHSIDVVAEAQRLSAPEFDLVICDEAHRTVGTERKEKEDSYFTKIHNADFIKAKKRLYMTATPRVYSEDAKTKAKKHDIDYYSMDEETNYGKEFYRLDFSEAVEKELLSDYRVLVLAVNEDHISEAMQSQFVSEGELDIEDTAKIIGCYKGLKKEIVNIEEVKTGGGNPDSEPLKRAVAFCNTIKNSELITKMFSDVVSRYSAQNDEAPFRCEFDHVDGKQNSLVRDTKLSWLKEDTSPEDGQVCRVLSNARCLSEGVDVPALDAVMFLNPRKSVVDVVQSVGRVMRKAEGKQYGYVILPVVVPSGIPADEALSDNKRYQVVWEVLQALRSHDNRFNSTINKIELNKKLPEQIKVIPVGFEPEDVEVDKLEEQLSLNFEQFRDTIFAKIVEKCGDRRYWETWAIDIAKIADAYKRQLNAILKKSDADHMSRFDDFLRGLRENINESIDETEAIEMLSQHMITKPVFNALFENYDFAKENPVSKTMQTMLDLLDKQSLGTETDKLEKFYQSVRKRAEGIDNAEGKQKIIVELYDKFFKNAFPKLADRLGIVYTPIEIVDFILQSVEDTMKKEFGKSLSDRDVDILDPFTGTGSFIVRLIQGDYIEDKDLKRKYEKELHANEIILLAYYIAAINIEEAYHFRQEEEYKPFRGILLTDSFQLSEKEGFEETFFPENYERAKKQNKRNIRVIVGNPPYSAGQRSENDANKNLQYPKLDRKIRDTYVKHSLATNKTNLYDSYVRSMRWASDRIGDQGVVAYVSNGSYIDGNTADGLRRCLSDEFSSIYCFNLRGNFRKFDKKEGQNVFGNQCGTTVAITLFVKNTKAKNPKCQIHYHDIGDYLKQKEKIDRIKTYQSVQQKMDWKEITPNEQHDWINQRDPKFMTYLPLGVKENKKKGHSVPSVFKLYSGGVVTARDAWVYNFSKAEVESNMRSMIDFYNGEVNRYKQASANAPNINVEGFIDNDPTKISWDRKLKTDLKKGRSGDYSATNVCMGIYRPFTKQWFYFDRQFNSMVYKMFDIFPKADSENLTICVSGVGANKNFSALMVSVNLLPDFEIVSKSQCFPLYRYEEMSNGKLFNKANAPTKIENIQDNTLKQFQTHYKDENIKKIDIFYYVYGILYSPEYKIRYEADLKKMLPRVPMHKDFWTFSKAGKVLGDLHVNYEQVEEYPLKEITTGLALDVSKKAVKMNFGKDENGKRDKETIIYNQHITLTGIPLEAYDYVVNGKSAIEWIMDRYQIKTDKDSQIRNDPNEWSNDPDYIISLIKKVVMVSVKSVKIINDLPKLG